MAEKVLKDILKKEDLYGISEEGKGKKILIELSSPNIAKPFGIGHLRSTIIGNSIANIAEFSGYKTIRLNYLGDWGTPFGKIILGYKKFGSEKKLKENPIKHLLEIYVKINSSEKYEQEAREWFRKLEQGDKEALSYWQRFRELSMKEFTKIYATLKVKFDVISGESFYNKKMKAVIKEIEAKKLLSDSEGAKIVDLKGFGLGIVLITKSDGATLYATRDLTAAIERHKKYKFDKMIYEVGSEQKLYFQQLFKVLELIGYSWAKDCIHVSHGLYLDTDGKKFATRKGKTIFMEEIIKETKELAKKEIKQRESLPEKELEKRALAIARAAIIYGDLKNYRENDIVFDIKKFLAFEGDTGPYLLYTYARAKSILRKSNKKAGVSVKDLTEKEKALILELAKFPETVKKANESLAPNLIANYSFNLAQKFNEFYHSDKVINSENEAFRLQLVKASAQVLKNSLALLGIVALEKM